MLRCRRFGRLGSGGRRCNILLAEGGEIYQLHIDPKPCKKCRHILQHGGEPGHECLRCGSGSGIWKCSKCLRQSRGRGENYWKRGCAQHNPLSVIPNQRGSGVYSQLQEDDVSSSDSERVVVSGGVVGHDPRYFTAACSDDDFASIQEENDDGMFLGLGGGLAVPSTGLLATTALTTSFEAIDADGNLYMQEMPLDGGHRPAAPLRLIFPVTGKATTPRTGRLARQISHADANNLTHAQVLVIKQSQKKMQGALAKAATAEANKRVRSAMHRSGVVPKLMHKRTSERCT